MDQEVLSELVLEGAQKGQSCAQVAQNCDIVITMLPNSPDVEKAILGKDGIIEGIKKARF